MSNVELGSAREIWLSPSNDEAGNKHSFLVRDDSYVVSEASFGRQIRLGQPIDLGPNGSWKQDGWFGGYDQERWLDEFMYEEGQVDTTERIGRARMWPGYELLMGNKLPDGSPGRRRYTVMMAGSKGSGEDTPLLVCESFVGASGTWKVFEAKPGQANGTPVGTVSSSITCIAPLAQDGGDTQGNYLLGTRNGRVYHYSQSGAVVVLDSASPPADLSKPIVAMTAFSDSVYYGRGASLYRRSWDGSGAATHAVVKTVNNIDTWMAMTVWQNRLWLLGSASGGHCTLFVSDGVTIVPALQFPHGVIGTDLLSHYGSLYIAAVQGAARGGDAKTSQIWRYNGSSLTQLWNGEDFGEIGDVNPTLAAHDRFVAWPMTGRVETGKRAGLWYYDAEEDAILEGPTLDMDPAAARYEITKVVAWNDTIAVSMRDVRTVSAGVIEDPICVMFVRRDGGVRFKPNPAAANTGWGSQSFGYQPATITRTLKSSTFDSDLPADDKVWLSGFIRCKVPQYSQLRVEVTVDGAPTPIAVKTISYDGVNGADDAWRNVSFDLDNAGEDIVGTSLNYTLYFENFDVDEDSEATPEVDFVAFQFTPAPDRRRIWYVRVLAQDNQNRLDGTPNPLSTRQAIVDKLFEFWQHKGTLSFWEAEADGVEPPDGDSIRVGMSNITDQPWRLSSASTEVQSETAFSLLETPSANGG